MKFNFYYLGEVASTIWIINVFKSLLPKLQEMDEVHPSILEKKIVYFSTMQLAWSLGALWLLCKDCE